MRVDFSHFTNSLTFKMQQRGTRMKKNNIVASLIAGSAILIQVPVNAQIATERGPFADLPKGRVAFAGYGDATYLDPDGENSAFMGKVVPIVLVQLNEQVHVEAEWEFSVDEDGETETELEYADVHYFATDSLTLTAGKVLLPFGQFGPNLHPSWINKLPSIPVIYGGHDGNGIAAPLMPILSDYGAGFQKTFAFKNGSRLFFDGYIVNGPSFDEHGDEEELNDEGEIDDHNEEVLEVASIDDGHDEEASPELDFEATSGDNNNDKAIGGRVGYVWGPGFEIGASYYSGAYDEDGDLDFSALGADINYTSTYFTFRGEYIETETEGLSDEGDKDKYDRDGWYLQGSWFLKQTGIDALAPVEFVVRRSEVNKIAGSERWSVGLNYWIAPSVVFKLSADDTETDAGEDQTRYIAQIAYGF
jgi:Gram-negative porin